MQKYIDHFLAEHRIAGWEPNTVTNFGYMLGLMQASLLEQGVDRVQDVESCHLRVVMDTLDSDGRARRTRVAVGGAIRRFFRELHEGGDIWKNPARRIPVPEDVDQAFSTPPLSREEVMDLLDGLPRETGVQRRDAALLEVLYGCGLRVSEAYRLRMCDIDFDRSEVRIRESKHGQERTVPLGKGASVALRSYFIDRREWFAVEPEEVFLTVHGTPWKQSCVYKVFHELNRERELLGQRTIYPHLLRHSIALHLLQGPKDQNGKHHDGATIPELQAFLGHKSADTTMIYLFLDAEHLRKDYDAAMPSIRVKGFTRSRKRAG